MTPTGTSLNARGGWLLKQFAVDWSLLVKKICVGFCKEDKTARIRHSSQDWFYRNLVLFICTNCTLQKKRNTKKKFVVEIIILFKITVCPFRIFRIVNFFDNQEKKTNILAIHKLDTHRCYNSFEVFISFDFYLVFQSLQFKFTYNASFFAFIF